MKTITEKDIRSIIQQILSVLSYLHEKSIVLKNFKLDNIMLETAGMNSAKVNNDFNIKIVDINEAEHYK